MVRWVLNLNCLRVPDGPDAGCQRRGAGQEGPGATDPRWHRWQTSPAHSQEVSPPPTPRLGLAGWRAGSRTSQTGGVCAGSGGRACPGTSKGRKGGNTGTCIVQGPLPLSRRRPPGARSWRSLLGRGPPLSGRWLPGREDSIHLHVFSHSGIGQLWSCGGAGP